MDLLLYQLLCPVGKMLSVSALQCVNDQSRQEEIIRHIAFLCDLLIILLAIACMDLRE